MKPVIPLLLFVSLVPGCASPRAAEPVAASQRVALQTLAESAGRDQVAIRSLTAALCDVRAETIRSALIREVASSLLLASGEPDHAALDAAIDSAADDAPGALVAEVRAGRLTRSEAHAWLTDFSLSFRLSEGAALREALVLRLAPARDADAARNAILAALDVRARRIGAVAEDALESSAAILHFTHAGAALAGATRASALELWRLALVEHIEDPARRADAERALRDLLDVLAPGSSEASVR